MKLTEGGKLQNPNVCTICERTPAIGEEVVDTERYFDGWPATLRGRRYICKRCVSDAAKLVTKLVPLSLLEIAIQERDDARREVVQIKGFVSNLEANIGSIWAKGSSGEPASAGSSSEKVPEVVDLEGDQPDVSGEDRPSGSEDSGSEGGYPEASGSQQTPSEPAATAA